MKSDKNVKATLSTKKKGCCRALVAAQLVERFESSHRHNLY